MYGTYPFTTQLCHIPSGISLAEQTNNFPIFGFHLFFRFYRAYLASELPPSLYTASFLTAIGMRYYHAPIAHRLLQTNFLLLSSHFISFFLMLTYSFIADYQEFNLRYKDNTTRDKNETKVGKQSANQFHEALHGDLTKRFLSC